LEISMDSKKIIAKLFRIAKNQQKIIEKLAQQNTDITGLEGGHAAAPAAPPPVTSVKSTRVSGDYKTALLNAMTDPDKSLIPVGAGGFSIEGDTLFWFAKNLSMPKNKDQLVKLHQDIIKAFTQIKSGGQFPDFNKVTKVQFRPFQQSNWQVGQ
jgi:hypothetical protein